MRSSKEPPMASGNMKKAETGLIFSIQHFCLHDGPGIRSLVFFKGCPLRCAWCQNPESWKPIPELGFKKHLCTNCRTCISVCPEGAIVSPGQIRSEKCRQCFACADACPSGALIQFGKPLSVQEIREELMPEYPFYQSSGGGVTFSGGEPTLYPEFAAHLAGSLKRDGIHLAIETCGLFHADPDTLSASGTISKKDTAQTAHPETAGRLLTLADLVLFDIKLFHPEAHRQFCGTDNRMIRENLAMLARRYHQEGGPLIRPRMPVIPGITDTPENLEGWGSLLAELRLNRLTLVPFHHLGEAKREWLRLEPGPHIPALTEESLDKTRSILNRFNISCFAPGEEDWPQPVSS